MVGFASANNWSPASFDEVMAKNGIYEGMEYSGGVDKHTYESNLKTLQEANQNFGKRYITKERGTTTSEYASGTSYSTTSGSLPVLIPIYLSPDIVNLSQKESPLYAVLSKLAVRGKFFDWNKATFASTNAQFLPEDSALPEYDDTYARSIVQMKYCYAVGRVTGPMEVASLGYIGMEKQEIMMKTRALIQKIENEIVDGNTSTDPDGFSGLGATIATNATALSAAISISDLRTSIRYCEHGASSQSDTVGGMRPNLMVGGLALRDDLKALFQSHLRFNEVNISFGIQTFDFEGIPYIASSFMTDTSGSKALYFIHTAIVKLGVSLDITFERLAKTNDSNRFMIKWYGALLVLAENMCAKITSIT